MEDTKMTNENVKSGKPMEDKWNETSETLYDTEANYRGNFVRVSRVTGGKSGNIKYDIRRMYTSEDGEARYTQKGIRLPDELVVDIVRALMKEFTEDERAEVLKDISVDKQ